VDRSQKDLGTLIKLHNLQKRLNFIQYTLGDWKQTSKYKNLTQQVEYVQKRLELLDQNKIQQLQRRTTILGDDLMNLQGNPKEILALKHNKDQIDGLYKGAEKVKETLNTLHTFIERFE